MTKPTESLAQAHGAIVAYRANVDAATEYGFQFESARQRENFLRIATVILPFRSWERRGKSDLIFIVNN
jgi:hypothetical protein